MVGFFRALAADFDGTLSQHGARPDDRILDSIAALRGRGGLMILVTGRILHELHGAFPDVEDHVDAIVAENGCVLWTQRGTRLLADPVGPELATGITARGVHVRPGDVLLAGSAYDRRVILEEIHSLGLDCQLVFNRSELMVLPSGINKATGLYEALGDLGVSRHSTVGLGDAENDRALLDTCEAGVAVANSVPALTTFADLAVQEPGAGALAGLIDRLFTANSTPLHSRRRQLRIGTRPNGSPAKLPSSQINMLIFGPPGNGKSHLAGLCAERLISLGYCLLVVDPEGDHQGLGALRGVVVIQVANGSPSPQRVAARFSQRFMSVVLDLSPMHPDARHSYLEALAAAVDESRARCGLPHWIVADEAQANIVDLRASSALFGGNAETGQWGMCLATHKPELIDQASISRMDAVVAVGPMPADDPLTFELLAEVSGKDVEAIKRDGSLVQRGDAYLAQPAARGESGPFHVASRVTEHHRHWHRYTDGTIPAHHGFYFLNGPDRVVAVARNLREFRDLLDTVPHQSITHHAQRNDFSKWLSGVLSDHAMAKQTKSVENQILAGQVNESEGRTELVELLRRTYGV